VRRLTSHVKLPRFSLVVVVISRRPRSAPSAPSNLKSASWLGRSLVPSLIRSYLDNPARCPGEVNWSRRG